jgi:hypothetical protein
MNERIKELAEQAGYMEDGFGIGHWDMPECKKFAELIVRECMDVLDPGQNQVIARFQARQWLAEHFGIKE